MIEETRKVHKTGSSETVEVSLPKAWCKFWNIKAGDRITMLANKILVIVPDKADIEKVKTILREAKI